LFPVFFFIFDASSVVRLAKDNKSDGNLRRVINRGITFHLVTLVCTVHEQGRKLSSPCVLVHGEWKFSFFVTDVINDTHKFHPQTSRRKRKQNPKENMWRTHKMIALLSWQPATQTSLVLTE
jgi:hypothetical protein